MHEKNLFWLAGIIDGEGSFTMNRRCGVNSGGTSLITRLQIGNTDMEMIKEISKIFVEIGVSFYYTLHNPHKKFPNGKRYLTINIEGYRSFDKLINAIDGKLKSGQKTKQLNLIKEYLEYRKKVCADRHFNDPIKDRSYGVKIRDLKNYQVPPSTTKRKASTELWW